MNNEEIAIKLENHENQIKSLKHRMDETEKNNGALLELSTSVKILATNMEHMAKEQEKQGKRLERLEREPAEEHKYYKRTILACIITTVVGALLGGLLTMIIH
ncbi:MAG: hypothetical protein E7571_08265 [Ruminococcaceae bacterium]|nr:hypothetical protein [Oscillospiraceae bacterium]